MALRTQDLKSYYHDAGYFYWGYAKYWSDMHRVIPSKSAVMILEKNEAVDIDDEQDWTLAEALWALKNG